MKLFKHIINIIVWTTVSIYIVIAILLHIPYIQKEIGDVVANAIANKLGTQVTIERVDLGLLNRIIIDDIIILDQKGKHMLQSARIAAKISLADLIDGKVNVVSAQLFSPKLSLYKVSETEKPNFQFVIDSLSSKDTTSSKPLNIAVSSLIMRHGEVAYDRYDIPRKSNILDLDHIHIKDFNIYASLPSITGDTFDVKIRKLSLCEQSGLNLRNLSFRFHADKQKATLDDFLLELPGTRLVLPSVTARYKYDGEKIIPASLQFNGTIENSTITPADMAFIVPQLKTFRSEIDCNIAFSGTSTGLNVSSLNVESPTGDLFIDAKGWAKKQGKETLWYADIRKLEVSAKTMEFLSENIKGKSADVPEVLKRCGNITVSGTVGAIHDGIITARSSINSDMGLVALRLSLDPDKNFNGHIETKGVNLKAITSNERLGVAALDLDIKGNLATSQKPLHTILKGTVSQFSYDGYTFSNINLDGDFSPLDMGGSISIDDPNINFSAEGRLKKKGNQKFISVNANLADLCPKAIRLTDRWGDARFSTSMEVEVEASNVNDSKGAASIDNFLFTSSADTCRISHIGIITGFRNGAHNMQLDSDFGHIDISGQFNYATLIKSFSNIIGNKLPTLPGLKHDSRSFGNNFAINAFITSASWIKPLLGINLDITSPLKVNACLDDNTQDIILNAAIDSFSLNDKAYRMASISMSSPSDTLHLNAGLTKVMDNGDNMKLSAHCTAASNKLMSSFQWNNGNNQKHLSGELNSVASFFTNPDGEKAATVTIIPSRVNIGNKQWNIAASRIDYTNKNLYVEQFRIEHGQQYIMVNGRATDRPEDSLRIDLQYVDVDYILNLVNFHSVNFSGEATGKAYVVAPFGKFGANAKLMVNHFLFENGRMGVLDANVDWNQEEKQIDIHAIADDGPDALTFIDGYVSPSKNFIDLGFNAQGTHINFLHSFTKSFIKEVEGQTTGLLRLSGPLDNINLTGTVNVTGEVLIGPLNTRYYLNNQSVTLVPDEIKLDGVTISDSKGNLGHISGSLFHKHLTRLSYDIHVAADNLLAYDFHDFGDNTFYGTVYGTGNVDIRGRSGLFIMDVEITPQPYSTFTYNVSSPDALSSQEFIEFNTSGHDGENHNTSTPLNLSSDMYLNFTINCTPNATIRLLMDSNTGDYINLNGNGIIRATYYDKGSFNMYGTYTVDHGTYGITIQNILKKNFTFNKGGTIVFGGNPFDAQLNLQASHTVNGVSLSELNVGNSFSNNTIRVNCLMNIGGVARSPLVTFDIDMPTVSTDEKQIVRSIINNEEEMNQQVVYLLGIGKFYPQTNNNASSQDNGQYSQTSLAMQSLLSGTISGQINSILGTVIKSDKWNFGANISTGDEGWNNAEYEGLLSGRLLNNRLLINGQFGYRDNAATASTSFIGDFDIRYLLTPNGNLALKVYNQTNDRYFTKSSLNTQGIGIIMKKDFINLRDLLGIGKKKKKKKDQK